VSVIALNGMAFDLCTPPKRVATSSPIANSSIARFPPGVRIIVPRKWHTTILINQRQQRLI
jgi:hypothetical protein